MLAERLDALAVHAGGQLLAGQPDAVINGLFTDTRTPIAGGLFVALRGDRFDGNAFASAAVKQGQAAAVVIDRREAAAGVPPPAGVILVSDTRAAYLAIAAAHRRQLSAVRWFAVTGSVGKSTTKEMLAHILEHGAGWRTHKNPGNFNNAVGLPHTILGVSPEHRAAVLELGTNHPGEIRQLAAVARPAIAIITCAAESHLEAFGSVDNVAREKADILAFQEPADTAILNADSPYLSLWRSLAKGHVMTFGTAAQADVRAQHLRISDTGCARFLICHAGTAVACALPAPGAHQAANALAAVAAALAAGVSLEQAAGALNTFGGMAHRLSIASVRGFTLVDDAYNANPTSFAAALVTLKALPAARKYVVAGDMLELGAQAEEYHRALGRQLAASGLAGLVTVGNLARTVGETAVKHGLPPAQWTACASAEAAAQSLRARLSDGDAVLVKGSHSVHLEKCCELLAASI